MAMQRVQLLLEPLQRRKLAELAKSQGKSIAEVTRQAIDIGLQALDEDQERQRMLEVLEKARKFRQSLSLIDVDIVADLHQMREDRDNELINRH